MMDIVEQNKGLRLAEQYPCPKCEMSGEITAKYNIEKCLIDYFCKACKKDIKNYEFFNPPITMSDKYMKEEKKNELVGDSIDTATYDIDAVDYYQEYRKTGEIIEVFQQYKRDRHILTFPPRHKEIDKILELLNKTGIKKITIIR